MAVSNAAARSWDQEEPPVQTRQRSWASNVPYEILDMVPEPQGPATPSARARRGEPERTARLHSVAGGRSERTTNYRPVAPAPAPTAHLEREYERSYQPRAGSALSNASALRMALYGVGAAAVAVVLYLVVSTLITWTQIKLDDMQYGNPRTTHLDAVVGNGDSMDQPTHFIALNLNRQVSIIELPGGDISKAVAISGPYLFGDGQDLTPVKMRMEDINGDGAADLLVTVKNEELAYINDKGTFRPITGDEKARIEQAGVSASPATK
jgi:hypothetical protein